MSGTPRSPKKLQKNNKEMNIENESSTLNLMLDMLPLTSTLQPKARLRLE